MQPLFTYMGTKARLATEVAGIISSARNGPLLDLFAGMSSVGLAVGNKRQVWCNDVQHFAHTVATATFKAQSPPHLDAALLCRIVDLSNTNRSKLKKSFGLHLLEEDEALALGLFRRTKTFNESLVIASTSPRHRRLRLSGRESEKTSPYCLFTTTYAGGYVGLRQAVELDSLRFAIDRLRDENAITTDERRWMLLGLCKALQAASNTTGHFAQYLAIKSETFQRFLGKRRRDIFREWLSAMSELSPVGTPEWRRRNKTFRKDALSLLSDLKRSDEHPAVIYADPPYTADHYSRYYHLWETLLRYDYPEPTGKGLYRQDRFTSKFSVKSKVNQQFERLIRGAAELGVELVLNYPKDGLVDRPEENLLAMLKKQFAHAEIAAAIPHQHSTMGASKGIEKEAVTELVFYAH